MNTKNLAGYFETRIIIHIYVIFSIYRPMICIGL